MARGKIKWFDAAKGYGFIKPDDGSPDVFVHLSKVMEANLPHLRPGMALSYVVEQDGTKLFAKDLSVVSSEVASRRPSKVGDDFADEFEKEWGLRQV